MARDCEELTLKEEAYIEDSLAQGQYLIAAEFLKTKIHSNLFENFIEKRFANTGGKPGPVHRALFKLNTTLIITTNYDLLLEHAHVEILGVPAEWQRQTALW